MRSTLAGRCSRSPDPVTSPLAEVPLALIRDGATLIRGADDLLADLGVRSACWRRPTHRSICRTTERRAWIALIAPSLPDAGGRERPSVHPRRGRRADPSGAQGTGSERRRQVRTDARGELVASGLRCLNGCARPLVARSGLQRPRSRPRGSRGTREDLPASEARLIDAFAAHLRHERRLSEHTVAAYGRDLTQLAMFLTATAPRSRPPSTRSCAGSWRSSTRWATRAPRSPAGSARSTRSTDGPWPTGEVDRRSLGCSWGARRW